MYYFSELEKFLKNKIVICKNNKFFQEKKSTRVNLELIDKLTLGLRMRKIKCFKKCKTNFVFEQNNKKVVKFSLIS